jgi:arylsulfatase A-like enzyme
MLFGKKARPNILVILTDQHSGRALGCAGNPYVRTPGIDSIAALGTHFAQAYCAQPLSAPSKVSFFTGLLPHQSDVYRNQRRLPETVQSHSVARLLAEADYECAYAGKWVPPHYQMEDNFGFKSLCGLDDRRLVARCAEFLKEKRKRPFFLVASFDNPHNICEWSRNQNLPWGNVPEVPLDECPPPPANLDDPPPHCQALRVERALRPATYQWEYYDADQWRRYLHAYYRLVEKVDAEIGKLWAFFEKTPHAENTLTIFSSDHGELMGAHGWNQKQALYEEAVHVPLIVRFPGSGPRRCSIPVSTGMDVVPTLCDYAGIPPSPDCLGSSLRPLVEGSSEAFRDFVPAQTMFSGTGSLGTPGRMMRAGRHKYVCYAWGRNREQLFDLVEDPGELNNLAHDARFLGLLDAFRRRLNMWCDRSGDKLWLNRFKIYPSGRDL